MSPLLLLVLEAKCSKEGGGTIRGADGGPGNDEGAEVGSSGGSIRNCSVRFSVMQ